MLEKIVVRVMVSPKLWTKESTKKIESHDYR